ncbi:MAG: cysteine synthase family protein [Treponema sp.]|nr:cysteine synthase family protein [Treponema sp.]MBQ2601523.1 cysteine synthase family protein [Treponema sp.]
MGKIYHSIVELVGNTPLLELDNYEKKLGLHAHILAKLEYYNPAGSVKDRIALGMIQAAERDGSLEGKTTLVEMTTGNTGIGIAAIAAAKGYKSRIYMTDGVSIERTQTIRAYGGEVIFQSTVPELTETLAATNNDFFAAQNELKKKLDGEPEVFFVNQTSNKANPGAHYETTGPEIWRDTDGKVDIFVSGAGTGGTISGTGRYLKEKNGNIHVVAIQPKIEETGITGIHPIEGLPKNQLPGNLDYSVIDERITVELEDSYRAAREAARSEGILIGISSGAALHVATEIAKRPENEGKTIAVIFPDTGLRYLSTPLFSE